MLTCPDAPRLLFFSLFPFISPSSIILGPSVLSHCLTAVDMCNPHFLSLSLPRPRLHYVFVCPSQLPFNLFSDKRGIFGLVMYNSSVDGVSVFIACKLEWYTQSTCVLMFCKCQNESRTACKLCVNEVFGFFLMHSTMSVSLCVCMHVCLHACVCVCVLALCWFI